MKRIIMLLFSFALAVANGCDFFINSSSLDGEIIDLVGTDWILESLNGDKLAKDTNITLSFDEKNAGGFAGCNSYGGEYDATAEGELTINEIGMTQQLCQKPEEVMKQEAKYIETLKNSRVFRAIDDRLKLLDGKGKVILAFKRRKEFPMNPRALVGTRWQLASWNNIYPLPGSLITIAFSESEINGFAGCRHYTGSYQASGDDIRFPSLGMVEITPACSDKFLIQEGEYTTSLSWVRNYYVDRKRLELFTVRGEVLGFVPISE